jgi:hypothetical protein
MKYLKIRGMYFYSTDPLLNNKYATNPQSNVVFEETLTTNPQPNVVCKEILTTNAVSIESLPKEIQKANIKAMEKIKILSRDPGYQLIFVSIYPKPTNTSYTIYMHYLYLDKTKDYNTAEFTNQRKFNVCISKQKGDTAMTPDIAPFIWVSNTVLLRSSLSLIPSSDSECSLEPTSKKKLCDYFLNVFEDSETPTFDVNNPLMTILGRDQPISQLESLIMFQGHIVDNVFDLLDRDKFEIKLSDYSDEIIASLLGATTFSLITNEMKETSLAILSETETRVVDTINKSTDSIEGGYISFERFKVKFATLTSYQVSRDIAFNLLVMNIYGNKLMEYYKAHNTYFANQYLYLKLLFDTYIVIIVLGMLWYVYFIIFQSYDFFVVRRLQYKIDFLFNFQHTQEHDEDARKLQDEQKQRIAKQPVIFKDMNKLQLGRKFVTTFGVKIILVFCVGAMVCLMIYANHKKSYNVVNYNNAMIDSNTMKVIDGVNNALFYLSKTNNNNQNVNTFGLHVLNSLIESSKSVPDKVSLLMTIGSLRYVDRLLKTNAASMTTPVKLGAEDRELRIIYDSLVDAMLSYKNGNSLLMIRNTKAVYPYVDIITNSVLLVTAVVMLLLLWRTMNPIESIKKAKEINNAIHNDELHLIDCMIKKEHIYYEINYIIILACVVVMVVFFVAIYWTKIMSSGSTFNVMLYNSPLYENRMTYNMDV